MTRKAIAPTPLEDRALLALDHALSQAYGTLRLSGLDAKERRACQGKWIKTGHDLADRAASCLSGHRAALGPLVPFSPQQIKEQQRRVLLLETASVRFAALAQDARDSLLAERAALYGMSTTVLRGVEWLAAAPLPPAEKDTNIQASLRLLRKDFAAKNLRIRQGQRRGAERRALRAAVKDTEGQIAALKAPPSVDGP